MARGNGIIAGAEPLGRYEECTVLGTPKPGIVMTMSIATALVGGRWAYEPAGTTANNSTYTDMSANGLHGPIAVLLCSIDHAACPPYKDATTAYATGERGCVYWPLNGDELNMILRDISGTGANQDFTPGYKLMVDDGTGKLLASTGSGVHEPFICLETKTDLAADYLSWVKYIG
jgi:hypothetical protein